MKNLINKDKSDATQNELRKMHRTKCMRVRVEKIKRKI
jgi:hypothetical protein